ncbi:MAG: YeeE/YedE thiosulfate transporter family protein [Candidatus Solibacter sp.]
MNVLRMKRWSPYAVGASIGVLSWFAFASVDRAIGVSTAIFRTAGMLERLLDPGHVAANAYYAKFRPVVDWEWMLVIGLAVGAWVSSRLSGDVDPVRVDPLWRGRFGKSETKRYAAAFFGGLIVMLGARTAGGCTSGHGISGSLQLAVSGWLFFASVFASGLLTAWLMYGKDNTRG